ncbi:MAG: hypothetical protein BM555_01035 [Crocinitomix sp. MedPE-SWsnd]|nr:MAG: hypothetical protein BM555_01035 [Crocinitomix sp. MedPE-SWsnd]
MRLLLLILLILPALSKGAEIKFVQSHLIKGQFDNFSVDNLGRIYVNKEDVLIQFSSKFDTLFTASLKSIRPSFMQSSKSFRTLLFDYDRSVIKFLDNTLTDIDEDVDLVNIDIQQPHLVCESFVGNGFWVLDAGSNRLVKLNEKLEVSVTAENIANLFDSKTQKYDLPSQMLETNEYLFISYPGYGVALFDVFGTYINSYPCNPKNIGSFGNHLIVQTEEAKMHIVQLNELLEADYIYQLPSGVSDFYYTRERLYLLTNEGISIGQFKKFE